MSESFRIVTIQRDVTYRKTLQGILSCNVNGLVQSRSNDHKGDRTRYSQRNWKSQGVVVGESYSTGEDACDAFELVRWIRSFGFVSRYGFTATTILAGLPAEFGRNLCGLVNVLQTGIRLGAIEDVNHSERRSKPFRFEVTKRGRTIYDIAKNLMNNGLK